MRFAVHLNSRFKSLLSLIGGLCLFLGAMPSSWANSYCGWHCETPLAGSLTTLGRISLFRLERYEVRKDSFIGIPSTAQLRNLDDTQLNAALVIEGGPLLATLLKLSFSHLSIYTETQELLTTATDYLTAIDLRPLHYQFNLAPDAVQFQLHYSF